MTTSVCTNPRSRVTATQNVASSVLPDGPLLWNPGAVDAVGVFLIPPGAEFQARRAGAFEISVRFNFGSQLNNLAFVVVANGVEVGNSAEPGEGILVRVSLQAGQTVFVRNKSGQTITPDSTLGYAWFTMTTI